MKRLVLMLLLSLLLLVGCMEPAPPAGLDGSDRPDSGETGDVLPPDSGAADGTGSDGGDDANAPDSAKTDDFANDGAAGADDTANPSGGKTGEAGNDLDEDGYYYDLESVVLYLETYDELPANFITKNEARDLGWSGGSVERYMEGAAIGGDTFGNREGLLPKGRYTECDLNTDGANSRGAERLVFSDDGAYYYTNDHYETFTQVWVENGEVVWE